MDPQTFHYLVPEVEGAELAEQPTEQTAELLAGLVVAEGSPRLLAADGLATRARTRALEKHFCVAPTSMSEDIEPFAFACKKGRLIAVDLRKGSEII